MFDSCGSARPIAPTLSTVTGPPSTEEPEGMGIHFSPTASPAPSHHSTPPVSHAGSPPPSPMASPACTLPRDPTPPVPHVGSPSPSRAATPLLPGIPPASPQNQSGHLSLDTQERVSPQPVTHRQTRKKGNDGPLPTELASKKSRAAPAASHPSVPHPSHKKGCQSSPTPLPAIASLQNGRPRHQNLQMAQISTTSANCATPDWFSSTHTMLLSPEISLGERWAELVELWAAFKKKEAFAERGKLPPNHRPQAISEWIQRAHSPTWRPDIMNGSEVRKGFSGLVAVLTAKMAGGGEGHHHR